MDRGYLQSLARIHLPTQVLDLTGVVDISETNESPQLFIIYGRPSHEVFLAGGNVAYRLMNDGTVNAAISLYRDMKDLEYWDLQIIDVVTGLLLIYEGGVLFLAENLFVYWHKQKLYNDFYESHDSQAVYFRSEQGTKWLLHLKDGQREQLEA